MAVVKLTHRGILALPDAGGKRADYHDALTPGLCLRVSPTGARTWSVLCYVPKFKRNVRVGLGIAGNGEDGTIGLADAREKARKLLAMAQAGLDPRTGSRLDVEAAGPTVGELGRKCLAALDLRPSTQVEWGRLWRVEIEPVFGATPAASLLRRDVRAWVTRLENRGSPATARHALGVLKRVWTWAIERDLVESDPLVALKAGKRKVRHGRVLSSDEVRGLWTALTWLDDESPTFTDATRLLLLTCLRVSALFGAKVGEFEALDDPAQARWVVPADRSKGARDHVVPLAPEAVEIVKRRIARARGGEFLFPARGKEPTPSHFSSRFRTSLRQTLVAVLKRPVDRWTVHGLRHTAATLMVELLGVPLDVVSLLLQHRAPGAAPVTYIYARAEKLAERREALAKWAKWVTTEERAATG